VKQQSKVLFLIALVAGAALAATASGVVGSGSASDAPAKPSVATSASRDKTKRCKKNCAPTVTMSVSPAKVRVGQTATLTWSAAGAASCTASEAWSGSQLASGSLPVTPTSGGRFAYTLACSSGSATTYASAVLAVPIPVLPSSYENRMAAGDPARGKGMPTIGPGGRSYSPLPGWRMAWADFFQDGEYSLVFASEEKDAPGIPANLVGHFYFFKFRNGRYEDHTSEILKDTTACLGGPAKPLVVDFNGDGVPDVYQECYGIDVPDAIGGEDRLLLSQPDGTYSNSVVPGVGKHHGATAADLNGDGLPDVLATDGGRYRVDPPRQSRVLINNGDGTFRAEPQRLPDFLIGKSLTTFELIDLGRGVRDLFVGGAVCGEESARAPTDCPSNWLPSQLIIQNDGHGSFANGKVTVLPNPPGETGIIYGPGIDVVYVDGNLYWYQYSGAWDANIAPFHADIVHRLNLTTQEYKRVFEHIGGYPPPDGAVSTFFDLVPWGDGTMRIRCMAAHGLEVVGICALSFPM
jgi:hypothetical protein